MRGRFTSEPPRMKIPFIYGLVGALVGALLNLAMFFTGMHDDPAAMGKNMALTYALSFLGFAVGVAVVVLAVRGWRNAQADGSMSFGRGVAVGTLTGVFMALIGGIFHVLYLTVINPAWHEALLNYQRDQMASKPMPAESRAMAEKIMAITMHPGVQAGMGVLFWAFFGCAIGLIAAAILKRPPAPPAIPEPTVTRTPGLG